MRKGSRWLMVSETVQSISGGEGMVTGGQSGGCHMVRTRKWRELDPEAGIGTIFKDLLLPTSFYRPGPPT